MNVYSISSSLGYSIVIGFDEPQTPFLIIYEDNINDILVETIYVSKNVLKKYYRFSLWMSILQQVNLVVL